MSIKSRQPIVDPNVDPFFYPKDITVGATAEQPESLRIEGGHDFWVMDMMFYNGGAAAGDLQIKLIDEGNVFAFMGAFVNTSLIFGDGQNPYTLGSAKRLSAGTTVSVKLKNTSATPRTCQLVLAGFKTPRDYVPKNLMSDGGMAVPLIQPQQRRVIATEAARSAGRVLILRKKR